jgi:hypothetical protein
VLVESNARGNRHVAVCKPVHGEAVGAREEAEVRALVPARRCLPGSPESRGRLVFRQADSTLVVHLDGAVGEWHPRMPVARFIGGFDGEGNPIRAGGMISRDIAASQPCYPLG